VGVTLGIIWHRILRARTPHPGFSDRPRKAPSGRPISVSPTHSLTSSMRMAAKIRSPSIIASSSRQERSNRNRLLISPHIQDAVSGVIILIAIAVNKRIDPERD
jgi:hypothetical protein